MSIYEWNPLVSLKRYGNAMEDVTSELYETYDQVRDLTISGSTIAGSGTKQPNKSIFFKLGQMLSGASFMPSYGSVSLNVPGTSYSPPILPGTGVNSGGQSSFGIGPMSQMPGFPTSGGSAAGFDPLAILAASGIGTKSPLFQGFGDPEIPAEQSYIGYQVGGGAAGLGSSPTTAPTTLGFGRNLMMPIAGLTSGIGSLLTTVAPMFGPAMGMAGLATGTVFQGLSGSILASYEHAGSRVTQGADTALTSKVRNLETMVKQFEAQNAIIKKLLKDQNDTVSKALQDLSQ